ncbi:MAG: hypothetical protein K0U78_16345 [Actinomycetia bacterium]|nr:hypothetical protein [Actinomycetes bacterium]
MEVLLALGIIYLLFADDSGSGSGTIPGRTVDPSGDDEGPKLAGLIPSGEGAGAGFGGDLAPTTPVVYAADARPNSFVIVTRGANLSAMVRKAYGLNSGDARVGPIIRCITDIDYNFDLYAQQWDPDESRGFPMYTTVTRNGIPYDLRMAFLNQNSDKGEADVRSGTRPERGGGSAYGVLWFPPVQLTPTTAICSTAGEAPL